MCVLELLFSDVVISSFDVLFPSFLHEWIVLLIRDDLPNMINFFLRKFPFYLCMLFDFTDKTKICCETFQLDSVCLRQSAMKTTRLDALHSNTYGICR